MEIWINSDRNGLLNPIPRDQSQRLPTKPFRTRNYKSYSKTIWGINSSEILQSATFENFPKVSVERLVYIWPDMNLFD